MNNKHEKIVFNHDMEVILFKLITGEEVIGLVKSHEDENEEMIDIEKPLVVRHILSPQGVQIVLNPFFWGNTNYDLLQVENSHVVDLTIPNESIEKAYLQQTSGIIMNGKLS